MSNSNSYPYYSIVTFGSPSYGDMKGYYISLASARRDLATLGGGSMTNARIVGCQSRQEAIDADISSSLPVVSSR